MANGIVERRTGGIVRALVAVGLLAVGTGCGGPSLPDEFVATDDAASIEAAAAGDATGIEAAAGDDAATDAATSDTATSDTATSDTATSDTATSSLTASIVGASITEGNSGTGTLLFSVALSGASPTTVSVDYATSDGTATSSGSSDFVPTAGTLNFPPGTLVQTIPVLVNGDLLHEADETMTVTLSSPKGVTIKTGSATGTIVNDDAPPTISINDLAATEGNSGTTSFIFTTSLSAPSGRSVSVNYATASGTATAGSDFNTASGTLTFAPGTVSQTIAVTVNGDTAVEPDETFTVNLSGATNATLLKPAGRGTIVNDDANLAMPAIAIGDARIVEGNSGTTTATFTVTLLAATTNTVTVAYASADGTATSAGSASSGGRDYDSKSGTLSFAPGETSKTISVTVNGDVLNEADETFVVELSGAVNATLADSRGDGTIVNDDPLPTISIADYRANEGNSGTTSFTFVVSLSAASGRTVAVSFATADGTATAGSSFGFSGDYTPASGTLTFAPGETSKTIAVQVRGDTTREADETFNVNLSSPSNATLADSQAVGTIVNDD